MILIAELRVAPNVNIVKTAKVITSGTFWWLKSHAFRIKKIRTIVSLARPTTVEAACDQVVEPSFVTLPKSLTIKV